MTNERVRLAGASLLLILMGGCGGGAGVHNAAPTVSSSSTTVGEDTSIAIGLLAADADGDALEYQIVSPPLRGRLSQTGSGAQVTYAPDSDFYGTDQFAFQVIDARGTRSAQAVVSINVYPQNDAPRALAKYAAPDGAPDLTLQEDSVASAVIDASDPEGDSVTFAVVTSTEHGSLQLDASGALTYAPEPDYSGPDRFTFVLRDSNAAESQTYPFDIHVAEVNDAPTAADARLVLDEDQSAQIALSGFDPDGDALLYLLVNAGIQGSAVLDGGSGRLTYTPGADRNGPDQLTFAVRDSNGATSAPAVVDIEVRAIDDPPRITLPARATNSAYTEDTTIEYAVVEVDGETVTTSVRVEDPSIATASDDADAHRLVAHPVARGATQITLAASDGHSNAEKTLSFEVTDVAKQALLQFEDPAAQAVRIVNLAQAPVSFTLTHNGFTSFDSLAAVVEYVRDMPEDFSGEPFERKLWRFLIANVVHEYPLTEDLWLIEPLVTVNSFGWGLCSNVANAYVRIARAAGLEARVWGLGGHVVPEIRVGGRWSLYDPDLSVYYRTSEGQVAAIADLQAQPNLITDPIDPLYAVVDPGPYGVYVASTYASIADNQTNSSWDGPAEVLSGRVTLPAGARLTYPGQWDDAPLVS